MPKTGKKVQNRFILGRPEQFDNLGKYVLTELDRLIDHYDDRARESEIKIQDLEARVHALENP